MATPKKEWSLLAQLSWRFPPRTEELAVAALAHILNRYPASRDGLDRLLQEAVSGLRLSDRTFKTEVSAPDGTRPDVVQEGEDGKERLFIEAKFFAPLTPNQPVPYLRRLADGGGSVLVFLAPSGRVSELWSELRERVRDEGVEVEETGGPDSQVASRRLRITDTEKHLLITDWTTLLSEMEAALDARLDAFESGRADLHQLQGLVEFIQAEHGKALLPGKELVNAVTDSGKNSGWLDTKRLRATPHGGDFGRYVRLGRRYRLGVWFGINSALHEEFAATPLWIHCSKWSDDHHGLWNERVAIALKTHASPYVKAEGEKLWVGVAPEDPDSIDSYAAALERIADILDGFAEPWRSPAGVLAEVRSVYDRAVMNNTHRGEYVQALVALALNNDGWTRKAAWEGWHFEHESGVRLKIAQSAATQTWGSGRGKGPPQYNIAPSKEYWDDKTGRTVPERGRHAEVYVFAWHGQTGETVDQRDPNAWEFYVIPEPDLPQQKSIGLRPLQRIVHACDITGVAAAVRSAAKVKR